MRTPTDTIGQHIHLVKFDVMASDGSANGWNYEDGTFAPDELAARICDAADPDMFTDAVKAICNSPIHHDDNIWRLTRANNRHLFQTTVQRWFADPILTLNGDPETSQLRDRTLRTVFTHDHFAPSSIQQHGFYSALLIEPGADLEAGTAEDLFLAGKLPGTEPPAGTTQDQFNISLKGICRPDGTDCVGPIRKREDRLNSVAWGEKVWEGTRRRLEMAVANPTHPDYREYALAVADFAVLYDPRDRAAPEDVLGESFGMSQLLCEAKWRLSPLILDSACGTHATRELTEVDGSTVISWYFGADLPPAWIAGGTNRDDIHKSRYFGDTFRFYSPYSTEVQDLREHLVAYRQKAAGHVAPFPGDGPTLATPVAPPARPEAISVDHHDPYVVNYRGAPLPLRIGDKVASHGEGPGHSNDCRLLAMSRQGEHPDDPADDSDVVKAFKAAAFPECSVDRQMAGRYGDMGEVLRSGVHGDPETPIFEAYANERLLFRMIQGAQEVQHTFNIAGLAFKRNIDQAFPRGAQTLGVSANRKSNPTMHDWCLAQAAANDGRPDDYVNWRDSPVSPTGPNGFWMDFETLIAECDNLEGFTFAQEIGISEHFEINGSLRSDVFQSLEFAPSGTKATTIDAGADGVSTVSSDYFYNFGSVDSLWNGAWGLVRIYKNPDVPDPATVLALNIENPHADFDILTESGAPISARLGDRQSNSVLESAGFAPKPPIGTSGLSCPVPDKDGDPQRIVRTAIVAFETEEVWPSVGTDYGLGRHDRDGLMLAYLSAEQLGVDFDDVATWIALTREGVLDAVKTAYLAPQPMTLRVNAGDCVQFRYVNALSEPQRYAGLRDMLGDATLPPIAPLNVDPAPAAAEHGATVAELAGPVDPAYPGGVRPSASLALNIGLTGMDLTADLPLSYGYGRAGLPPANGDKVTVSRAFLFYAGRMRLRVDGDEQALDAIAAATPATVIDLLRADPDPWLSIDGEEILDHVSPSDFKVGRENTRAGIGKVLDQKFRMNFSLLPAPVRAASGLVFDGSEESLEAMIGRGCPDRNTCAEMVRRLRTAMATAIAAELSKKTHWIPYAFGPAPIRSTSDIIGHVQHGLFGAVDIVPRSWVPQPGMGQSIDCAPAPGNYRVCNVGYTEPANPADRDGHPMVFAAPPVSTGTGTASTAATMREFVLYYQDGLNLHDDASRISWKWADDVADVAALGDPPKMVPDCPVCDDSYDRGEKGVSYRSISHAALLSTLGERVEDSDDKNLFRFPENHVLNDNALRLRACVGETVVIRVVHPGGRARQRAFAMNAYDYDDLFPGFGFPRSALLAPGKGISAWLWPKAEKGTYYWHDGPTHIRSGGVWGRLEVEECG